MYPSVLEVSILENGKLSKIGSLLFAFQKFIRSFEKDCMYRAYKSSITPSKIPVLEICDNTASFTEVK